jgi:hypothetical protein
MPMTLGSLTQQNEPIAPPTYGVSAEDIFMPHYTAIVTLLAVAFYFFLAMRVTSAHRRFNVSLPATTANPDFERIFRAHMNTLEWIADFLGAAVALCNLLERRRRSSDRPRLDPVPCRVFGRLQ